MSDPARVLASALAGAVTAAVLPARLAGMLGARLLHGIAQRSVDNAQGAVLDFERDRRLAQVVLPGPPEDEIASAAR